MQCVLLALSTSVVANWVNVRSTIGDALIDGPVMFVIIFGKGANCADDTDNIAKILFMQEDNNLK